MCANMYVYSCTCIHVVRPAGPWADGQTFMGQQLHAIMCALLDVCVHVLMRVCIRRFVPWCGVHMHMNVCT